MQSIVIIFPDFGTLPVQYKMWRASALCNPSVKFMFFTDTNVEPAENIIVHQMSFSEFKKIVQGAFNFDIVLDRPYKLCEYKQAYGYILHNYIKNYDFWGFGDLDIVYGNIRKFLTDIVLYHKFILGWGHLTLMHNDEDTNTYFMKHIEGYQDYRDAFTTSKITFFDEFNHKGCSDKWRDCRPDDCWLEDPFDNVSRPKEAFHFCSLNRGWEQVIFEHVDNHLYMIRFNKGTLEKLESLYAHFQHRGMMKDHVRDYSHFLVIPEGMVDYPQSMVMLRLRWLCRKRWLKTKYYQWRDYVIWRMHMNKNR